MNNKTKEWARVRAELKKEFEEKGIVQCEVRLQGCWHDNALSFAHLDKRKDVKDLKEVVLACVPCHQKVEYLPKGEMRIRLQKVIDSRS